GAAPPASLRMRWRGLNMPSANDFRWAADTILYTSRTRFRRSAVAASRSSTAPPTYICCRWSVLTVFELFPYCADIASFGPRDSFGLRLASAIQESLQQLRFSLNSRILI